MSAELFIEIFCEELPADSVHAAAAGLEKGVREVIAGLEHGAVRTFVSPRHLAIQVEGLSAGRPLEEKQVTGPPAERAFDSDGKPTKAALGFARGRGVDPELIEVVETPKGKVIAVTVREGGEQTVELVAAGLDAVVRKIPFERSMEWGRGGVRFGRPIHRVSAVYDGATIACEAAGCTVGNATEGHRLAENRAFAFTSCAEWAAGLRERFVEPDADARKARIREMLVTMAGELGSDPIEDEVLLEEVTHLVEWPVPIVGAFDEKLLELPARLLIESMRVHQRYFPIHANGKLTNRFAIVSNNPWGKADLIAQGNARVLRARFHDAEFFFAEDKKQALAEHGKQLETMQWIRGLGTMAQKEARLAETAATLAGPEAAADARRAGELAKSDLPTQMVGEFPELQGHMGRLYALAHGESEAVAVAIEEHYLPRFADDEVPASPAGVALALADRLDALVGCFGVGMVPKGGDPQGLRRAALGMVNITIAHGLRLDLSELFGAAIDRFHASALGAEKGFEGWRKERGDSAEGPKDRAALVEQLVEFTLARFRAAQVSAGSSGDLVDAALAVSGTDTVVLKHKLDALKSIAQSESFLPIMTTFKRVLNITRDADEAAPEPSAFTEGVERELHAAVVAVEDGVAEAAGRLDYTSALTQTLTLVDPVANFFEGVMVEDSDPAKRACRRGLLRRVSGVFLQVADFARISTR